MASKSNGIGELAESSLHNALKLHYQGNQDDIEQKIDGYVVDVVTQEDELVEIQTSSFSSVKKKYTKLLKNHKIRMVYPISIEKWIVKQHKSGKIERRKSPKEAKVYEVFRELVSIPKYINHPNFRFDIVFIHEDEYRVNDGKGSWRRKGWSIVDHKLVKVVRVLEFQSRDDFISLIPSTVPKEFTTADLSSKAKIPKYLAQKMAYTLNKMGAIKKVGKKGRYNLFEW